MFSGIKTYLLIGAAVLILGTVGGLWFEFEHRGAELKVMKADLAAAQARALAAERNIKIETQIQTVTRKVYVKAKEAQIAVQAQDPKCADAGPFIDSWRSGVILVRNSAGSSTSSASPVGP